MLFVKFVALVFLFPVVDQDSPAEPEIGYEPGSLDISTGHYNLNGLRIREGLNQGIRRDFQPGGKRFEALESHRRA